MGLREIIAAIVRTWMRLWRASLLGPKSPEEAGKTLDTSPKVSPPDEPSVEAGAVGPPDSTGVDNEAPVGQSDKPVLENGEFAKSDVKASGLHETPPNTNPPTPPGNTPEKTGSPSTQPDEGHLGDISCSDTEVGDPSGSDPTAAPSEPPKKTKPAKEDIPGEVSNSPGSKTTKTRSKPAAPSRTGGMRTRTRSRPKEPSQRRPTSRPELICRRCDLQWEVVLSANDECRIEEVQHDERPVEMKNGEYRLSFFNGSLSVACKDRKHIEFPLFSDKPLIFKLQADWKGEGRQVDYLTTGHFIVIAPIGWKRTSHVAVAPDGCMDTDFLAHYFHSIRNDSTDDVGGFEEYDLPLKDPQADLIGDTIFDDSEEGQLFGGNAPPLLAPSRSVVWARVGEEGGNSWTGDNFKPTEQALAEILDDRQGRFFLRVYDDGLKLLDSCEFRYFRSLKEIQVNDEPYTEHTTLEPSSTGHLPTKVRFIGTDGVVLHPILPSEEVHVKVEGDCLIVDPHPNGDVVSCVLESDSGRVDTVLRLPRIWWQMKQDASEPDDVWRDKPITMTRREFREFADTGAVIRLRLPQRIKSVHVGFDDELEREYALKMKEDERLIRLGDFADYAQIDRRLSEDALLNVECGGTTLPLIRVFRDTMPTIVSFTCEPATVIAGEPATLCWETRDTEAAAVAIDPDVGAVEPNASVEVTPLKTTAYTLKLTALDVEDVTKVVTVAVRSLPVPDDEQYAPVLPGVKCASGGWKYGKGFSYGELQAAGLSGSGATDLSLPVDKRRRSVHPTNIDKIRNLIDV